MSKKNQAGLTPLTFLLWVHPSASPQLSLQQVPFKSSTSIAACCYIPQHSLSPAEACQAFYFYLLLYPAALFPAGASQVFYFHSFLSLYLANKFNQSCLPSWTRPACITSVASANETQPYSYYDAKVFCFDTHLWPLVQNFRFPFDMLLYCC